MATWNGRRQFSRKPARAKDLSRGVIGKITDTRIDDDVYAPSVGQTDERGALKRALKAQDRLKRAKKWRLIVRNLPFSTSEESIYELFKKFGGVEEVQIPRKRFKGRPESSPAGYAFVQMEYFPDAYRAMTAVNGTELAGRQVAVDWAVPKDEYLSKTLPEASEELLKKVPSRDNDRNHSSSHQTSPGTHSGNGASADSEPEQQKELNQAPLEKKPRFHSNVSRDVAEGRTLFVRNLPYSLDDEELLNFFMEESPDVEHTVICRMPGTKQSRGTAFVRFKSKDTAEQCLSRAQNEPLRLDDRELVLLPALSREEVGKRKSDGPKDKRNLSLLQLTHISVDACNGMSEADTKKRRKIEMNNNYKLKHSTNVFVSRERVVIHNLPKKITDESLQRKISAALFDYPALRITECRVMRDLNIIDSKGNAQSRGFAFVTFADHDQAKLFIEKWNNNPSVFTDEKRPIVEFSIENIEALQAKKRRIEKSKAGLAKSKVERTDSQVDEGHDDASKTPKPIVKKRKRFTKKQKS